MEPISSPKDVPLSALCYVLQVPLSAPELCRYSHLPFAASGRKVKVIFSSLSFCSNPAVSLWEHMALGILHTF